MFRRALCLSLLLFQAIWLNVIVPGHTRGVVSLPGCAACDSSRSSLAFSPAACCGASRATDSNHHPVRDPASNCAICYFATVSVPPAIDFTPPRLGLAEILKPPAPRSAESVRVAVIRRDRGPPRVV
jgi:hypothetical protein